MSSSWGRSEADQRAIDEAEQKLERRTEERERRHHAVEPSEIDVLRAELQQEVANLRAEVNTLHEVAREATGSALGEYGDKIIDRAEKMIKDAQIELSQKFGELRGYLDGVLSAGAQSRPQQPTKEFKFANEADAVDLPNPLLHKTIIN
jgi:hypothetical protein